MSDHDWVTVSEAATRLGMTKDGVRKRIERGKITATRDNTGQLRVSLSSSTLSTVVRPVVMSQTPLSAVPMPQNPGDDKMIPAVVLEVVERERERERADHARQLADRDNLHLGHIERLMAQAAAERSLFLERVDAAELRAEAAEARAAAVDEKLHQIFSRLLERPLSAGSGAEPARPWWARWFGQTKQSDLGG